MDIKRLDEVPPFITKDGSEIRELLAYRFRCGVPRRPHGDWVASTD
jgi:hypothetical protein